MKTIILQSHNPAKLKPWLKTCMRSVEKWADLVKADYALVGDDLFEHIPTWVMDKVGEQLVIATDLARLRLMQTYLDEGYSRVVWMDADMLVFAPEMLALPQSSHAVGREVWVQKDGIKLKAYKKVHNAFLMSTKGDSFLPFYADAAERMLAKARLPLVPQFIGPKFLAALHNMTSLSVEEGTGMLSPLALRDVLGGGGEALRMTVTGHARPLAALNLSASYCGRPSDGVHNREEDYQEAIDRLLAKQPL